MRMITVTTKQLRKALKKLSKAVGKRNDHFSTRYFLLEAKTGNDFVMLTATNFSVFAKVKVEDASVTSDVSVLIFI